MSEKQSGSSRSHCAKVDGGYTIPEINVLHSSAGNKGGRRGIIESPDPCCPRLVHKGAPIPPISVTGGRRGGAVPFPIVIESAESPTDSSSEDKED